MGVEDLLNKKLMLLSIILLLLVATSTVYASDNDTVEDHLESSPNTYSFIKLNEIINDNEDTFIELHDNFTFESGPDDAFVDGIVINRSLSIFGNGITINGNNQSRIFNITADNVFIRDINFINACSNSGGAVIGQNYGVISCNFINNIATKSGGAIFGGTATDCNFEFNSAREGGAIANGFSINSTFTSNHAKYGGALYNVYAENSTFISNFAEYSGAMEGNSALNCKFFYNVATNLYGAGYFYAVKCEFRYNSANKAGALGGDAMYCKFISNSADEGGAVLKCNIINSTFENNHARLGGAIFGDGESIVNCNFTNNSADGYGGALYNLYALNCKFNKNSASIGGAIYDGSADNCEFVSNSARESYGAVYGYVVNSIFISNTAPKGGALGDGSAKNSYFEANTATNHGGALYGSSAINCTFKINDAKEGGAMYGGSAVDCDFISNHACLGGAIAGSCSAVSSNFINNVADISGGANYESSILNCYLDGNLPKYMLSVSNFEAIYGYGGEIKVKLSDSINNVVNGIKTVLKIYDSNNNLVETGTCLSGYSYFVNLDVGKYSVQVNVEDESYVVDPVTVTVSIKKLTAFYMVGVTSAYNINNPLIINLHDSNGFLLKNTPISVNINGIVKTYITNNDGQVLILTNTLNPNIYYLSVAYSGNDKYSSSQASSTITVLKANPFIIASNMKYFASEKTKKFYMILKNNLYQPMNGVKVTLKVNGKKFTAKTNSKGRATFKIKKLNKKGKYKATVSYSGNTFYNSLSKSAKITVKK